jgi:hypothetical protein
MDIEHSMPAPTSVERNVTVEPAELRTVKLSAIRGSSPAALDKAIASWNERIEAIESTVQLKRRTKLAL